MKVRAFTLAEVLITLGIIGIVAAMTLPTLIQKQQDKVLINQLKVANSTLSNALLLAYKDYDTMQFWTDASSGAYTQVTQANFEKYFLPYFKVLKYCGRGEGCFSKDIYFNKSYNPTDTIDHNSNSAKAILTNGMSVAFASLSFGDTPSGNIIVDVNGFKGPNKWGKDVFYFAIPRSAKGIYPSFSNEFEKNGTTYGLYSTDKRYSTCLTGTTEASKGYCTGWALRQENFNYLKCTDANNCKEE